MSIVWSSSTCNRAVLVDTWWTVPRRYVKRVAIRNLSRLDVIWTKLSSSGVSFFLPARSRAVSSQLSLHEAIIYSISNCFMNRKRKGSDSVLWQKPLHQQKRQKGKVTTQTTPQKSSITQRLWTDLGRSVGVATATRLVWFTWFTGPTFQLPATAV